MISLTEKVKSHLLPDLTAKDRARKYHIYEDDRLKMQRYDRSFDLCSRKSVMGKHLKSLFIAVYP